MPDHEVIDFEDDPPSESEAANKLTITPNIGQAAVKTFALNLERDPVSSVDQIDPSNPSVAVAKIDLGCERPLAVTHEHLVDASLEMALGWSQTHWSFSYQLTHQGRAGTTPLAQLVDQTVQHRPGDQSTVVAGVEQPSDAPRVELSGQVEDGSDRCGDPHAVDLGHMAVVECRTRWTRHSSFDAVVPLRPRMTSTGSSRKPGTSQNAEAD